MEVNSQLLTLLVYVFHLCTATILVKFGRLPLHYAKNSKNGVQAAEDPLRAFDLPARQLLCDSVINARQFVQKYAHSYYKHQTRTGAPRIYIHWDLPAVFADATWNYQRLPHANALHLKYKLRWTQMQRGFKKIRSLCCVYTKTVKWYLTFGLIDHFMYLLEYNQNKFHPALMLTGILEPSALLSYPYVLYFRSQLLRRDTNKSRMESLCNMSQGDKLRICSAIYDALDMGNGARLNYLKKRGRDYANRKIHTRYSDRRTFKFLQCTFFQPSGNGLEIRLYVLADVNEKGAVFVFSEGKTDDDGLVLKTIVRKIGALLNPLGLGVRTRRTKDDEDLSTEDDADEEPLKTKNKRRKLRKNDEICEREVQTEADVESSDGEKKQKNKIVAGWGSCSRRKSEKTLAELKAALRKKSAKSLGKRKLGDEGSEKYYQTTERGSKTKAQDNSKSKKSKLKNLADIL